MLNDGYVLRACAGAFDCTAANRPDTPVFFERPPFIAGTPFRVPFYQPGYDATFCLPLAGGSRRAPYATREWLARNATMPMLGQEPLDADGVVGVTLAATRGWLTEASIFRVPRSLVILCQGGLSPFTNPDWLAAITAAVGPLQSVGVDVYVCGTDTGMARFLAAVPVSLATFAEGVHYFDSVFYYTSATTPDPSTLTGGDVLFVALGEFSPGYPVAFADLATGASSTPTDACYVTITPQGAGGWTRTTTNLGNSTIAGFNMTTFLQTETASYEAAYLSGVAARCRTFGFDVYGNDLLEPYTGVGPVLLPSLEDADAAFRNGISGNVYHYSYDPSVPGVTQLETLAAQLVANSLTFFA